MTQVDQPDAFPHVPGVCSWYWDARTDELFWSADLCALSGLSRQPTDLNEFLALVHPDDRARVLATIQSYLEQGTWFDHEFRIVRPDGDVRWILDRGGTVRDEQGKMLRIYGANIDVSALHEAQEARLAAERRAALAARMGGLIGWEIDHETGEVVSEEGLAQLFGLAASDFPRHASAFMQQVHPDDADRVKEAFKKAEDAGVRFEVEFRVRQGEGWRWTRARGELVRLGGRLRMLGFNQDVDAEHRQRAEKEMVSYEMAHRTKNAFALILALARQTFSDREEMKVFEGRVSALAVSNEVLISHENAPSDLGELIEKVLSKPLGARQRICLDGDPVRMPAKLVLPLSLALHELGTNAYKYGALSNQSGQVHISWRLDEKDLILDWEEVGGPTVKPPQIRGFGTRLLFSGIEAQLDSRIAIIFDPRGVKCRMRLRI